MGVDDEFAVWVIDEHLLHPVNHRLSRCPIFCVRVKRVHSIYAQDYHVVCKRNVVIASSVESC